MKCKLISAVSCLFILLLSAHAQQNPIYENIPVGKYQVGFKIITLTDDTRVGRPEFDYLGKTNEGDRRKKFTLHIWYPAASQGGKRILTYEDYCYNGILTSTTETTDTEKKNRELTRARSSVERWFGKTADDRWTKLLGTKMLAGYDAEPAKERFPLLIGILRTLSTTIVNEMLASNGYVVCMIKDETGGSFAEGALYQVPDMQFAINYLSKNEPVDIGQIGTFGFSGSGFTQILFSMFDPRVKAVADIESGIYMDVLFQSLAASNYYNPAKIRVPFLHIFSRDLSKQEKFIDEFERKTAFSQRYRLIINQPGMHHWDFAAEGFTSALMLENRGIESSHIAQSFEVASIYLLNFFNAALKNDGEAKGFLAAKPVLKNISPALWDITSYAALKPPPRYEEFEYLIKTKGIREAIAIVNSTIQNDSTSDIRTGYMLNGMGYNFLNQKKYEEAIAVFKLNISLHPDEANWFDSMAEAYELSGDKENMKKISQKVLDILAKKTELSQQEKSYRETAEKRLKQ